MVKGLGLDEAGKKYLPGSQKTGQMLFKTLTNFLVGLGFC
jgi:hypothetical protein